MASKMSKGNLLEALVIGMCMAYGLVLVLTCYIFTGRDDALLP